MSAQFPSGGPINWSALTPQAPNANPQILSSMTNPNAFPLGDAQRAALMQGQEQMASQERIANLQGGRQMAMGMMNLEEQRRAAMAQNAVAQQGANQQGALIGSQIQGQQIEAKAKMLDFMKQQMLMDASQKGGYGGYMDTIKALDPGKWTEVQAKTQEIQTSILGQRKSLMDLDQTARNNAVNNMKDIGGTLEQVRLAGDKAAFLYSKLAPEIKKIDPNAPDSISGKDDPYVEAGLGLHMSIMDTLAKQGVINPIQQSMLPQETQEGLQGVLGQHVQTKKLDL
jgi:hypothetical protein